MFPLLSVGAQRRRGDALGTSGAGIARVWQGLGDRLAGLDVRDLLKVTSEVSSRLH